MFIAGNNRHVLVNPAIGRSPTLPLLGSVFYSRTIVILGNGMARVGPRVPGTIEILDSQPVHVPVSRINTTCNGKAP